MNSEQVKGNWKQLQGKFKKEWGKLTDDDLTKAEGRSDILVGKIQERYGKSKEEAKREFDSFITKLYLLSLASLTGRSFKSQMITEETHT